jgi:hypothetical protein
MAMADPWRVFRQLFVALFESAEAGACSVEEHDAIVRALRRRDAASAIRAMVGHLDHVEQRVLARMPRSEPLGATDLSLDRIAVAASSREGQDKRPLESLRAHHELHRAIPGTALDDWEPEPSDPDKQVLQALHLLAC